MRGLYVEEIGRSAQVADVPLPTPGPGQSLLRVKAAPLNPADIAVAAGTMFAGHPPLPYIPGLEVVGEVVESAHFEEGTLVFSCLGGLGTVRDGACAEYAVAADDRLIALPAGTEPLTAAAAGTAALAAYVSLNWRAPVHPGDVVMILGATGSVGLVAVQTAKLRGAGRVVAVGRDHGRLGTAMSAGADAAVALDDPRGLAEAMREEAGGDGPTLVFDVLWGEPVVAALTAAARGARVLNLGQSAGPSASIPSALVRGKDLDLRGYTNFSVPDEVLAALYLELVDHIAGGRVAVSLETSSLDEAPDAWKRLEQGASAKLVVCP